MATEISWVRSLFSESYTFSARNMSIGEMKIAMFSGKGEGSLLGQKVHFKSKGVLSPKVELYDDATGKIIGRIEYVREYLLRSTAQITLRGVTYDWRQKNIFSKHWYVRRDEDVLIEGTMNQLRGTLMLNNPDVPLVFAGMLIRKYYLNSTGLFTILFAVSTVVSWLLQ
jgi:hypothetical protein